MTRRRFVIFAVIFILAIIATLFSLRQPSPPVSPLALSPLNGPDPDPEPADAHFVYVPYLANNYDGNLLRNPGFEQGYGGSCKWLDYETGWWRYFCHDEQDIPLHWVGGWIHEEPCETGKTGLPEMRLAERWVDPRRVRTGDYAAQGFSFFRCGHFWWEQTVNLTPGTYQASAYIQTWVPETWVRVCLETYCTPWWTMPDEYLFVTTPELELTGGPTLYRVECMTRWAVRNSDCYVDDARVERK